MSPAGRQQNRACGTAGGLHGLAIELHSVHIKFQQNPTCQVKLTCRLNTPCCLLGAGNDRAAKKRTWCSSLAHSCTLKKLQFCSRDHFKIEAKSVVDPSSGAAAFRRLSTSFRQSQVRSCLHSVRQRGRLHNRRRDNHRRGRQGGTWTGVVLDGDDLWL